MIRVAITQGDTNGIGYELIFKVLSDPALLELCTPIIYGSAKVAAYHRKALNMQANFSIITKAQDAQDGRVNLLNTIDEEVKVDLGTATPESAKASSLSLDRAMADWQEGLFDVLVTAPVSAESLNGKPLCDYLAEASGNKGKALDILSYDCLHLAILASGASVSEAAAQITKENVTEKAIMFFQSLKRDLRINNPRIALLTYNPMPGKEEEEVLTPVTDELREQKVYAFGPFTADQFFATGTHSSFDGILAMYHDQGVIPFNILTESRGVHLTAGLPGIHVSTSVGPCFEIAGKGVADESSLRNAIYTAIDACRARQDYDEPLANPLKKLYHERRDDSEKVRFTIPKKQENSPKE